MTLAEFFLKLVTNQELLDRFYDSDGRNELIDTSDLSDAHRELLRSGSLRQIRATIEIEFEIDGEIVAFGTVYVPPITVYCPPPIDDPK
jgi:hypothetical protein